MQLGGQKPRGTHTPGTTRPLFRFLSGSEAHTGSSFTPPWVVWCGGCAVCYTYLENIQFDDAISILVKCIESSCVKECIGQKPITISAMIVCAFLFGFWLCVCFLKSLLSCVLLGTSQNTCRGWRVALKLVLSFHLMGFSH